MLKKKWGQHLLTNENVAKKIVNLIAEDLGKLDYVLELGPGRGALTRHLLDIENVPIYVWEVDPDMRGYLNKKLALPEERIFGGDFLDSSIFDIFGERKIGLIGNFPYNISGAIIFKVLKERNLFPIVTGMFQKEVAERLTAQEGSKTYGISSVLTALCFKRTYHFTVNPGSFNPPPKVKSGVVELEALPDSIPAGRFETLERVVRKAFHQRRKKLKNTLKEELEMLGSSFQEEWSDKRPEEIPPEVYYRMAGVLEKS